MEWREEGTKKSGFLYFQRKEEKVHGQSITHSVCVLHQKCESARTVLWRVAPNIICEDYFVYYLFY